MHYRNQDGVTPLLHAANRRNLHALDLLLECDKVDVNFWSGPVLSAATLFEIPVSSEFYAHLLVWHCCAFVLSIKLHKSTCMCTFCVEYENSSSYLVYVKRFETCVSFS